MSKKTSMQNEVEKSEGKKVPKGQQMPLIDVGPENSKEIAQVARNYRALVDIRLKALAKEVVAKEELRELIRKENLKRLEDGKIRFKIDGLLIEVTPTDEKIKVTEDTT